MGFHYNMTGESREEDAVCIFRTGIHREEDIRVRWVSGPGERGDCSLDFFGSKTSKGPWTPFHVGIHRAKDFLFPPVLNLLQTHGG